MGDDNWEPSTWYRNGYVPPRRRAARTRVDEPERRERYPVEAQPAPRGDLRTMVKRILLDHPDANVDEIIERLNTSIRVSPIVVSAIKTEFRHSIRVIKAAGLWRERAAS